MNGTTMIKRALVGLAAIAMTSMAVLRAAEISHTQGAGKIDRRALVTRHNVVLTEFDATLPRTRQTPLQVGNGHFAFGLDVTGLQTFMLQGSFSHATLSDWGWHTAANPEKYLPEETMVEVTGEGGRKVPYASNSRHRPLVQHRG